MENSCLIALIKKFRNNDITVFPVIFSEFDALIRHYGNKSSADDTSQELTVFLLELLYKMELTPFYGASGDGLKRYISVAIRNRYIAYSRLNDRKNEYSEFFDVGEETDFLSSYIIKDALEKLNHRQRQIIINRYIYNYSEKQIGEILGISRQAVNQTKNRAIEFLRGYFK